MNDRLPPQSREAERAVLGSMIRDNACVADVLDTLPRAAFYYDAHQKLFAIIVEIDAERKPIDLVTLADKAKQLGSLDDIGGYAYLGELWDAAPTAANVLYYAAVVRQKFLARELILKCTELTKLAYSEGVAVDDLVEEAQHEILSLSTNCSQVRLMTAQQGVTEFFLALDKRMASGGATGVATGLTDLDHLTAGLQKGELCILAARPSVGKTSLATQIAINTDLALYVSLEMRTTELVGRLIAGRAGVDSHKIRHGKLSHDDISRMAAAGHAIGHVKLLIADEGTQRLPQIRSTARKLKATQGLSLLVIDYLQLIDTVDKRSPRHEQVSELSRSMKHLARDLDIPILCLAQLNRDVEHRGANARPRLSDLRECVSGETRLTDADNGRMTPIRRLKPGQNVLGLDKSQKVVSGVVEDAWKTGSRMTYRLTTKTGRFVECTKNHPFLTHRGWVRYGDLLDGDRIAVAYQARVDGVEDRDDACRLLGYMAGNGSAQKHRTLGLIIPDDDAFSDACSIIKRMFPDVSIKLRSNNYNDAWISQTFENGFGKPGGNAMINWLKKINVHERRDRHKTVPDFVFEAGVSGAANFLAGYLATDGCVKKRERCGWSVHFDTTSFQLGQDVALLCARIGVLATVGNECWNEKSTVPIYRVSLSGEAHNIRRFREIVPVVGCRANLLNKAAADLRSTRSGPFLLPPKISELASMAQPSRRHQGKWMNREACAEIAEQTSNQTLLEWSHSDIIWDEIRRREAVGVQDVYDARISGIHNFLANGIIVHNSGSLEQDADTVILLHREGDRTDGPVEEITAIVAKQRNGATGDVGLMFRKEFMMFENAYMRYT
jgi:replicative DNA helicase